MRTLSVSSSPSRSGGTPVWRRIASSSSGSEASASWRPERLTVRQGRSMAGSAVQRASWRHASQQHPAPERDDQAALLGDRHELAREHDALARMAPAHEPLDGDDAALVEVHERLVVELELVALERLAQVLLELEALDRAPAQRGVEELVARSAVVAGARHRDVGVVDERLGAVALAVGDGDADAGVDEDGMVAEHDRRDERVEQPLRDLDRPALARQPLAEHPELVAAHARERVAGGEQRREPLRRARPAARRRARGRGSSLTTLKRSRPSPSTATVPPSRAASASAWWTRSTNSERFGSAVSGSWRARCSASCSSATTRRSASSSPPPRVSDSAAHAAEAVAAVSGSCRSISALKAATTIGSNWLPGAAVELLERGGDRQRLAPGADRGHGVVGDADGDHARAQRDRLAVAARRGSRSRRSAHSSSARGGRRARAPARRTGCARRSRGWRWIIAQSSGSSVPFLFSTDSGTASMPMSCISAARTMSSSCTQREAEAAADADRVGGDPRQRDGRAAGAALGEDLQQDVAHLALGGQPLPARARAQALVGQRERARPVGRLVGDPGLAADDAARPGARRPRRARAAPTRPGVSAGPSTGPRKA